MNTSSLKQYAQKELFLRYGVSIYANHSLKDLVKRIDIHVDDANEFIDLLIDLTYKQALSDVLEKLPDIRVAHYWEDQVMRDDADIWNECLTETKQAISLLAENNS